MRDMRDRLAEILKEILPTRGMASGIPIIQKWDYKATADKLIANGAILPPCKVGDTVYQVDGVRIYPSKIREIAHTASNMIFVSENIVFDERAIDNSIFLTREEAERELKEMGRE